MAASFGRTFLQVAVLVAGVLCTGTEAGFAAAPLVAAPVATTYLAAAPAPVVFPAQGVLRSAYSQVVGRSYAPSSFVPVATSLAYAAPPVVAPVVRAVPTAYVAPQLVAGPVLKTVAAPSAVAVPLAPRFAAPLPVAAPAPVAPVVRTAAVPAAIAPAFAPSAVLASRVAPFPAPVAPAPAPAPAASLPGVIEARDASAPAARTGQTTFLTAFGSPEGIRLGFEGTSLAGVASTSVESARAAPAPNPQNTASGRGAATPAQAASNQETFGVPQPAPFPEYGLPASVNP
ncbi:angiomotin-like [Anopheles ziemanni]|uniref:angiomotin-like n=1 Tax=Anopheles coustani TaxID=139045 RepID=UPI002657D940|nr:angiomotin-like [Anopheles coustani]XP_058178694.1 angiomotin-like [Anopheles ziemanni]